MRQNNTRIIRKHKIITIRLSLTNKITISETHQYREVYKITCDLSIINQDTLPIRPFIIPPDTLRSQNIGLIIPKTTICYISTPPILSIVIRESITLTIPPITNAVVTANNRPAATRIRLKRYIHTIYINITDINRKINC